MWKLLLFGIGMSVIICLVIRAIGKREIRKDYDRDFAKLEQMVKQYKVNEHNFAVIENKFTIIYHYRCRDNERLDVLEREFYFKFKRILNEL